MTEPLFGILMGIVIPLLLALTVWVTLIDARLKFLAEYVGITTPADCTNWRKDPGAFHALPGPLTVYVNGIRVSDDDIQVMDGVAVCNVRLRNGDRIVLERGTRRMSVILSPDNQWTQWVGGWMNPSSSPPGVSVL